MNFDKDIAEKGNDIIRKFNSDFDEIELYLLDCEMWLKINCNDYVKAQHGRNELAQLRKYIIHKLRL